jgi:tRNA threonylcarbamoyladenosine biosynthesis protein TsaE
VPAAPDPVEETRFLFGELGARDRDGVEAELAAPPPHAILDAALCRRFHFSMVDLNLQLPDEAATLALGAALAAALEPGLSIHLRGELGAGKTTLVRGVLRALGHPGPVKSPTYTLVELYEVSRLVLHHFDFYRFHDPREWSDAGFRESFNGRNVSLIEWPEKAGGLLPPADVEIHLASSGDARSASLRARSEPGRRCLVRLAARLPSASRRS